MRSKGFFLAVSAVLAFGVVFAEGGATNIESYTWTNVRPTAPFDPTMWAPRAGLQAVELRNDLYAMGGRGPFSFETETVLYGDVWKSTDAGATWTRTASNAWPARGYFGAVTHRGRIFVIGGQNFSTRPNPSYPDGCPFQPPDVPCLPVIPDSTFFDDVWSSRDGVTWIQETADAPWEGRAGLSVVVHAGAIYVLGGSQGDDASTGGSGRVLFNDVWMSRDGRNWTEVTGEAPWARVTSAARINSRMDSPPAWRPWSR